MLLRGGMNAFTQQLQLRDARYWIFADIRYANIFQLILADTDADIFPFVWKQHQVSPVQKL